MSKFKIGDKVRVVKVSSIDDYKIGDEMEVRKIGDSIDLINKILFFNYRNEGLYDYQVELIEKELRKMKIQEVLKEENVGKKFEFNGTEYKIDKYLDMTDKACQLLEDNETLIDILNGDFKLIEEYKEVDHKEGLKMLLEGRIVQVDDLEYFMEGNKLKYKDEDGEIYDSVSTFNDFLEAPMRIKIKI